jgi:type III restriction enzyme
MSQLLCEQVVGRGLRRSSYEIDEETGLMTEEVAKVFGVPFEVIPFKQVPVGPKRERARRHHVHAVPAKSEFEITFPRVEGYGQAIRNRVIVDWDSVAKLTLDPLNIPPEVDMKAGLPNNLGRVSLTGPGRLERVDLNPYRSGRRLQALVFEMARDLTRDYCAQASCQVPAHVLFPQITRIVKRYFQGRVEPLAPADLYDAFLSPYYGWIIERLQSAIQADATEGESRELPCYERHRGPGSTGEVDFWTSKEVREVEKSHLNYIVADTTRWEQSAAYAIDHHPEVSAFAKNAGLGFAIPYLHNGQVHDYVPDFLIRLRGETLRTLVLETKGYDPLKEVKAQAAQRWCRAVNAHGASGQWRYALAERVADVTRLISEAAGS